MQNKTQTKYENLQSQVMKMAWELLNQYEQDIESGIEDGTYEEEENVETRAFIAEAKAKFAEFEKAQPAIYIYVEGGNIQGASANCNIDFNLFDQDNYDATEEGDEKDEMETPDEWDEQITELTEANEIKPIY